MEHLLQAASPVSAVAISALFSAIWEGSVLAVCVLVCLRLLPRLSAASRSVVWMNVFLLLVLLHMVPSFREHLGIGSPVHASSVRLDLRWSVALAGLWAMLSVWRGTQLILSAIRLRRLANRATPIPPDPALLALLKGGQGGRAAELCTSVEVERPSVFRLLSPSDSRSSRTRGEAFRPGVAAGGSARDGAPAPRRRLDQFATEDWPGVLPAESGVAVGGAAALCGEGACLRRPRPALWRRTEGLRCLPDAPRRTLHASPQPFACSGRLGTAAGVGAPGASPAAAPPGVNGRQASGAGNRQPAARGVRWRNNPGSQPAACQLRSACSSDGAGLVRCSPQVLARRTFANLEAPRNWSRRSCPSGRFYPVYSEAGAD